MGFDPYASLRGGTRKTQRAEVLCRVGEGRFTVSDLPCSRSAAQRLVSRWRSEGLVHKVDTNFWGAYVYELSHKGEEELRMEAENYVRHVGKLQWLDWDIEGFNWHGNEEEARELCEAYDSA